MGKNAQAITQDDLFGRIKLVRVQRRRKIFNIRFAFKWNWTRLQIKYFLKIIRSARKVLEWELTLLFIRTFAVSAHPQKGRKKRLTINGWEEKSVVLCKLEVISYQISREKECGDDGIEYLKIVNVCLKDLIDKKFDNIEAVHWHLFSKPKHMKSLVSVFIRQFITFRSFSTVN